MTDEALDRAIELLNDGLLAHLERHGPLDRHEADEIAARLGALLNERTRRKQMGRWKT